MALILHSALFIPGYWVGTDFANGQWLRMWWPIVVFDLTSYWIFFELALNIVRGNPILYYDHKEGDSGWIDEFFKWAGPTFHTVCKILAFIVMILSGILIYMTWK